MQENAAQIASYKAGIIVQTTGEMEDDFDIECIEDTSTLHRANFVKLHAILRRLYPDTLALGAGGCKLCPERGVGDCTYPQGEPCRFPDEALSSMEGYGLLVSDVCEKNGLKYYYGPQTLTYTGCYLLY